LLTKSLGYQHHIINNGRIGEPICNQTLLGYGAKIKEFRRQLMHNLVSYNQLAGSYDDEQDNKLTEYYECLIDCLDDQHVCKRICREVLT